MLAIVAAGVVVLAGVVAGGVAGWWLCRRTDLSPRNAYIAFGLALPGPVLAVAAREPAAVIAGVGVVVATLVAAVVARGNRVAALGAGGELRSFELARRMLWQPSPVGWAGSAC